MSVKRHLPVIVVMILLAMSFVPMVHGTEEFEDNNRESDNINYAVASVGLRPGSDLIGEEYIPISSAEELSLIGSGQKTEIDGKTYTWSLDAKYFLTNDIDFGSDDTNGGVDITMSVTVSYSNVNIKITSGSETVSSLYAWIGRYYSSSSTGGTVTVSGVPSGTYTLSVGGMIGSNAYAYSMEIDTTKVIPNVTFNSNGNFTPIGTSTNSFSGTFDGNGYKIIGLNVAMFGNASATYAGLFGYTSGATISDLGLMDSSVTASVSSSFVYSGGIVGYAYISTTITDCYNTGTVTTSSSSSSHAYAGGIAGMAIGSMTKITDCYNTCSVITTTTSSIAYAGGVIGSLQNSSATVSNCYNTGNVTAMASSSSAAYAGGTVGYVYSSTVSKSYNTGNVSATASSSTYAGGIAGYIAYSAIVSNCYNIGAVSASSTSSTNAYAGGMTGYAANQTEITNCYNTGRITATSTSTSSIKYAGGIAGHVITTAKMINCYFLKGYNGSQTIDNIYVSNSCTVYENGVVGTQTSGGRTSTELKDQDNYYTGPTNISGNDVSGWDFEEVWIIIDDINDGYPILRIFRIHFAVQPEDKNVEIGETVTFTSLAKMMPNAKLEYQWYISTDSGVSWEKIEDATSTSYTCTVKESDNGTMFKVLAVSFDDNDVSIFSKVATIHIVHMITVNGAGAGGHYTYTIDGKGPTKVSDSIITVPHGSVLAIIANANTGYTFQWTGDYHGEELTVNEPQTVTGVFMLNEYIVTVTGVGDRGSFTYTIDNGTTMTVPSDGMITVSHGSALVITAVLDDGYSFTWESGETGSTTVTVVSHMSLSGTLELNKHTVSGSITLDTDGISGLSSVVVEYKVNGETQTPVMTDSNGKYTITVYYGSVVEITDVKKDGHTINGEMRTVTVLSDISDLDFTMTLDSLGGSDPDDPGDTDTVGGSDPNDSGDTDTDADTGGIDTDRPDIGILGNKGLNILMILIILLMIDIVVVTLKRHHEQWNG